MPLSASTAAIILLVTSTSYVNAAVALWGQCGGIGYSGETTCVSGAYCNKQSDWYSQCIPGTGTGGGSGTTTTRPPTTTSGPPPTGSGLHARFVAKGKQYFGAATDRGLIQGSSTHEAVLKREFGSVTPENSMKWDATEPSRGSFQLATAEFLVNWAQQNGKKVRGHTLVWHSQLPSWVSSISSRTDLESVIRTHINTVAGRFKGQIHHWDVVNEIFNENGSFRSSVFYNVLGESFVTLSFNTAKSADGTAKLYINDYNLDSNNAKTQAVVSLVNRLRSAGVPIDGIGTQVHLGAGQAGGVQAALTLMASGSQPEVAITELDIAGAAANDYTTVVRACLNTPKCVGITVWGVRDTDSWRASSNPLLFDGNYNPKPAYTAILGLL
ncbi:hypothetical protein FRC03_010278 [Tulasnella sp. 419]|nr:hypothetical protein FRC03_010278 [Tulasnella sp. 419]